MSMCQPPPSLTHCPLDIVTRKYESIKRKWKKERRGKILHCSTSGTGGWKVNSKKYKRKQEWSVVTVMMMIIKYEKEKKERKIRKKSICYSCYTFDSLGFNLTMDIRKKKRKKSMKWLETSFTAIVHQVIHEILAVDQVKLNSTQ